MLSRFKLHISGHKLLRNQSYICNQFLRCSTSNILNDTTTKLPIIDISSFLSSTRSNRTLEQHQDLVDELRDVASKIGFFYLTGFNDIVSEKLVSQTLEQLKLFFNLPLDEKMKIHASNTEYLRGYLGCGDQGYYGFDETDKRLDNEYDIDIKQEENITDMKEVFTMGTELDFDHKYFNDLLFGPNIFPNILPEFEDSINEYYDKVLLLSDNLFQLFAIALDKNCDYFDDKINEGMNSMNCIYYMPVNKGNIQSFGIGEHTDYECFTLLLQDINSPTCLEVLMNDGKWKKYKPIENTFVVNFGDCMARFSNDMFRSTVHRAVNDKERERYSIAYFRHCNFDVNVSNLIENQAEKYKPVIAGEHMLDRVERANKPLDSYKHIY